MTKIEKYGFSIVTGVEKKFAVQLVAVVAIVAINAEEKPKKQIAQSGNQKQVIAVVVPTMVMTTALVYLASFGKLLNG